MWKYKLQMLIMVTELADVAQRKFKILNKFIKYLNCSISVHVIVLAHIRMCDNYTEDMCPLLSCFKQLVPPKFSLPRANNYRQKLNFFPPEKLTLILDRLNGSSAGSSMCVTLFTARSGS